MTRRDAVLSLTMATALALPLRLLAQQKSTRAGIDSDFFEDWLEAQKLRPASLSSTSRIAKADEPGTPLTVSGTIFAKDGVTPQAGAVVFGYQTDQTGTYGPRGSRTWRLTGEGGLGRARQVRIHRSRATHRRPGRMRDSLPRHGRIHLLT